MVVLSTALSSGYYTSLSTSLQSDNGEVNEGMGEEGGDVFVMWELALEESPKKGNTALSETRGEIGTAGYGATRPDQALSANTAVSTETSTSRQTDKFAGGRVGLYVPLIGASLSAFSAICVVSASGYPGTSADSYLEVGLLTDCLGLSAMFVLSLSVATAVFLTSL